MCIYIHVYMCGFFTCNINVGKNAVCRDVKNRKQNIFLKGLKLATSCGCWFLLCYVPIVVIVA